MTVEMIALSALAAETGLMMFVAYNVVTAPEGYEDSSGFHYVSRPVESARAPQRAEVLDGSDAPRRRGRPAKI